MNIETTRIIHGFQIICKRIEKINKLLLNMPAEITSVMYIHMDISMLKSLYSNNNKSCFALSCTIYFYLRHLFMHTHVYVNIAYVCMQMNMCAFVPAQHDLTLFLSLFHSHYVCICVYRTLG